MPKKLLIVDDEAGILQLLKDYFEIQGYEVVTAKTGKLVSMPGGISAVFIPVVCICLANVLDDTDAPGIL